MSFANHHDAANLPVNLKVNINDLWDDCGMFTVQGFSKCDTLVFIDIQVHSFSLHRFDRIPCSSTVNCQKARSALANVAFNSDQIQASNTCLEFLTTSVSNKKNVTVLYGALVKYKKYVCLNQKSSKFFKACMMDHHGSSILVLRFRFFGKPTACTSTFPRLGAFVFVALGTGAIKPNVMNFGADQYDTQDERGKLKGTVGGL